MSKGEELISKILKQSKIPFEREKVFTDLRAGRFRFDFYCPNVHGAPALIEINGRQHYQQVIKFQPKLEDFKKYQEHDRQKISYALAHQIPMYCIPFWELQSIKTTTDIFSPNFRVKNRWHNDYEWAKFNTSQKTVLPFLNSHF